MNSLVRKNKFDADLVYELRVMSTPAYVDSETITQADEAQSCRMPVPLPDDPYVAVRQAQLVDTESELKEAPSEAEELQSLGSRVPLIGEEFEAFEPSAMRAQLAMSLGHLARVAEAIALSDLAFRKSDGDELWEEDTKEDESSDVDVERERESQGLDEEVHGLGDEDHGLDDESQGLEDKGLGLEEEEVVPEGQQQVVPVVETDVGGWIGQKSRRVSPIIPAYVPLSYKSHTPLSPEWSLGSLPVSPSSPIVPSPIASPVATQTATISRLDALPPTLVVDIDRDVKELYTRPVLALEAWAGHVDTRIADMSRAWYDDHRLIHDMLVQQSAMRREL
ncbi:hypothetical protein Tco_0261510 [Tanacetum coccineum]